ncbi:hypothetical protein CJD35_11535 [Sphingobium xenophagum]|uniref:ParB-like N-terminal domain-containing protein n=1 Tax=Sphingobium xenophagum TaxID=121428 RepID=A0A249MUG2_SPHXE|nr:ParB/RepB/Spo0J family partition protein [Sphingobium xenophagum]ASY45003.1 hypothetical protein CJD35_11535 [Sphingobium xenophagum]
MPTATKRVAKKAAPVAPIEETPVSEVVSGIDMIPLGRLMRAPENVRHTDKAVDVDSLADDIAAHGLLQNLIGYRGDTSIDAAAVYIVGGGRRLQALSLLRERGVLDADFAVPVLLRPADDAVALSLSENLAKRDMNPADEFLAFEALMKPGLLSPADLARKFGFSERYVKQRLRLAALAPEILDAMRAGQLTIDAAMAYAESQDHKLQLRVFTAEAKKSYEPHKAWNIRFAYQSAQMTTSDPLFKLAGASRYEEQGGRYEDNLFADAERYGNRKVIDSPIVLSIARAVADFQKKRLLGQSQKLASTTSDVLIPPGIRRGALPKAPKGFKLVDRGYRYNLPSYDEMRKDAAAKGIDIVAIASVDQNGEFSIEDRFFVPAGRLDDVMPAQGSGPPPKTQEEIAAEQRAKSVRSVAAFLAAKKIRDDKVEGRSFWRTTRPDLWRANEVQGIGPTYAVGIDVLVTPADIDAQLVAAEIEYDRQEVEKAAAREEADRAKAARAEALAARRDEVLAIEPPPAVILVDGCACFRWESGAYADARENSPDADECSLYDDLTELFEHADTIGLSWASVEAYDAHPHGDNAAPEADDVDHVGWADDSVEEAA